MKVQNEVVPVHALEPCMWEWGYSISHS